MSVHTMTLVKSVTFLFVGKDGELAAFNDATSHAHKLSVVLELQLILEGNTHTHTQIRIHTHIHTHTHTLTHTHTHSHTHTHTHTLTASLLAIAGCLSRNRGDISTCKKSSGVTLAYMNIHNVQN